MTDKNSRGIRENQIADINMHDTTVPSNSKLENKILHPEIGISEQAELRSIGTDSGHNKHDRQEANGDLGVTASGGPNPKPVVVEMRTAIVKYPNQNMTKDGEIESNSGGNDQTLLLPGKQNNGGDNEESADASDASQNKKPKTRRLFEINHIFEKTRTDRKFVDNKVTTTKYTCLNFVPKNLFI